MRFLTQIQRLLWSYFITSIWRVYGFYMKIIETIAAYRLTIYLWQIVTSQVLIWFSGWPLPSYSVSFLIATELSSVDISQRTLLTLLDVSTVSTLSTMKFCFKIRLACLATSFLVGWVHSYLSAVWMVHADSHGSLSSAAFPRCRCWVPFFTSFTTLRSAPSLP